MAARERISKDLIILPLHHDGSEGFVVPDIDAEGLGRSRWMWFTGGVAVGVVLALTCTALLQTFTFA